MNKLKYGMIPKRRKSRFSTLLLMGLILPVIKYWNKVKEYNIEKNNRWGEMVFNSDHMEQHWTGEGAQQGVYIYKVIIRDVYNVLHEVEGVVELLL